MFDIGNHLQLATAIRTAVQKSAPKPFSTPYNSWTQRDFYVKAIEDTAVKGRGRTLEAAA